MTVCAAGGSLTARSSRDPRKSSSDGSVLHHCVCNVVSTQNSVCEECIVNERGRVAVAPFRMLWGCSRLSRRLPRNLALAAQMRFNAHVCQHSAKNDFVDLPLA